MRQAPSPRPPGEADRERAARRLHDWRSQPPFATGPYFARRLAAEGITEDELLTVLGEPSEAVDGPPSAPPPWMEELERALARPTPPDGPAIPLPEALREHATAGFLVAIEPLLARAVDRLRQGIRALASSRGDLPFDPATVEAILLRNLPASLLLDAGPDPGAGTPRGPPARPVAGRHARRSVSRASCDTSASPRSSSPCFTNIPSWPGN